MGDFDTINLDLKQTGLATQKKKRVISNDLREGVVGNAFSVFIEQAIARTEQSTDGQNDQAQSSTDKPETLEISQSKDADNKDLENNKQDVPYDRDPVNSSANKNDRELPPDRLKNVDLENLREALAIAGQRLEQFLYISPENGVQIKKVDSIARVNKAEAVSIDNLLEEMVQNIKKAKAGNLNKLSITLKPENFGEMEIFFTVFEEDRIKKIFISFAGNEDALNLIRSNQQQLTAQLSESGHFLGGMDFVLYGGNDHQREKGQEQQYADSAEFVQDLLKSTNKQDIIKKIDSYVADLIVNYIT